MPRLVGRVVERFTQRPVAGATVRSTTDTAQTDSNGYFDVGVPSGVSNINISAPNYRPIIHVVTANAAINNIQEPLLIDSVIRAL